jgi:hypothetical protein
LLLPPALSLGVVYTLAVLATAVLWGLGLAIVVAIASMVVFNFVRELTADPGTAVNVILPEVVVRGWARLLHNQRALYIKRLLLFEKHVILSSVPYQLFR